MRTRDPDRGEDRRSIDSLAHKSRRGGREGSQRRADRSRLGHLGTAGGKQVCLE